MNEVPVSSQEHDDDASMTGIMAYESLGPCDIDESSISSSPSSSTSCSSRPAAAWRWFVEWPFRPPSYGSLAPPTRAAAMAQGMDSAAKGVMHASAAFFGPALLQLALDQVKRQQASDLLFGFWHPSSVLTTSSVIAVFMATVGLPFLGAYIDRQRYDISHTTATVDHGRYTAGKLTAYALVAIHLLQKGISASTWLFFWVSHTIAEALNMIHQMIILAYLQDLTSDVSTLTRYTSHFALIQFICMLIFFSAVAVYARTSKAAANNDEEYAMVHASRFANGTSGIFGLCIMGYAWAFLFSRRKQQDHHHPGTTLTGVAMAHTWCEDLVLSWQSVTRLVRLIRLNYPALQWLIVTLLFSPSVGSGSYFSIFSTLHKVLVGMDSAQIGMANLVALFCAMVGSRISIFIGHKYNELVSFQLSLVSLMATFAGTACFVHGPQDKILYFFFLAALGTILGWLLPTERVLFCTLAPNENQAEMMGLLVSVHTALAFIPPLLFSVVTQLGMSVNVAVMSQNVLLALALLASYMIGPFDRAVAQARCPVPANPIV